MTPPRIFVLHTSPATVDLFKRLLQERVPGARTFNILDDSVLPELQENGGDVAAAAARWRGYASTARSLGADLILNACSSIGELCEPVSRELNVPIIRVDARLAREAVSRGRRIAVVATLASTMRPTRDLILETARREGRDVEIVPTLVDGAYQALMAGNQATHDERVVEALREACETCDVVVLAQASMARALARLDDAAHAKCLTSPPLAVDDVVAALAKR